MSTLSLSPARQKFWHISRLPEAEMNTEHLVEAALAIAWEEQPRIDLGHYRDQLDRMGTELKLRIQDMIYPLKVIKEINQYLFVEQKFRGNENDYYNPRNSFITDVIDRRTGIPITLSVVYMAVGARIGFPLEGVSLPGHFIIRPQRQDVSVFIDPFAGGEILFEEDCAIRLAQVYGQNIKLEAEYLQPVGTRRILERMLMNLKQIYLRQSEFDKALAAVERVLMLYPDHPIQLRDRGLLCYQLERYTEALFDLETYLDKTPEAEDSKLISKLIMEIKNL